MVDQRLAKKWAIGWRAGPTDPDRELATPGNRLRAAAVSRVHEAPQTQRRPDRAVLVAPIMSSFHHLGGGSGQVRPLPGSRALPPRWQDAARPQPHSRSLAQRGQKKERSRAVAVRTPTADPGRWNTQNLRWRAAGPCHPTRCFAAEHPRQAGPVGSWCRSAQQTARSSPRSKFPSICLRGAGLARPRLRRRPVSGEGSLQAGRLRLDWPELASLPLRVPD